MKKRIILVLTLLALVIVTGIRPVGAADDFITVSHASGNSATAKTSNGIMSNVIKPHDFDHPRTTPAKAMDLSHTNGPSSFGQIFHYVTIGYKNGVTVRSVEPIIDVMKLENPEDVVSLYFVSSNVGLIEVNGYLNEVHPDNLLSNEPNYGRTLIHYTAGSSPDFINPAASLLVDDNFAGYEFVSSSVDITTPINYELTKQSVDLVYRMPAVAGTITVNYLDTLGAEISASIVFDGEIDDLWQADRIIIAGYEFESASGPENGIITEENIILNYTYKEVVECHPKKQLSQLDMLIQKARISVIRK